jgi:2'-5' RNA ligase
VTLARLKNSNAASVAAYLGARGYFPPLKFTAERFVLFSSKDSVGGGPYVLEAEYPLIEAPRALNGVVGL